MAIKIARDSDGEYSAYAWPGGYTVFHVTDDCETLCAKCANDPKNPVHTDAPDDGWRIVGSDINWEETDMVCIHCGEVIPASYGDDPA
jgi:hypothetical protein